MEKIKIEFMVSVVILIVTNQMIGHLKMEHLALTPVTMVVHMIGRNVSLMLRILSFVIPRKPSLVNLIHLMIFQNVLQISLQDVILSLMMLLSPAAWLL